MRNILYLFLCAVFVMTNVNATVFTGDNDLNPYEYAPQDDDYIEGKKKKVPGYILKKDGKKEEGSIIPGSVTSNEVKVIFIGRSGKKQTFKPKQLQGYGYQDSETDDLGIEETRWIHYETHKVDYPPKPFGPKIVFMEREVEGTLSLFCYYVEVRDNPKKPYRYFYYMKDASGKMTKVEKKSFNKVAKKNFKDYTAMSDRIGRKDFIYRNLDRMVRDYNYWTENQHDSSEYRVAMVNDN